MKKKRSYCLIWFAFLFLSAVHLLKGQDDTLSRDTFLQTQPKRWQVNGYVKNMQTLIFFKNPLLDDFLQSNLLHQRTNVQWSISKSFNFKAELRTRAFYGDLVRIDPNYATQLDQANDYADLSLLLINEPAGVLHSMLDRLYLEYTGDKWEVRLGRQRINWGISTVWNPNDIFNAFSFTDFDYEERPGSDALRIRYFTGFAGNLELSIKAFDHWRDAVVAGMWKFNAGQFDWQLLAGYMRQDGVIGAGCSGNLGDAGLKAEATYFFPLQNEPPTSFAFTAAADYAFKNSLYLQLGYLYNSSGSLNEGVDQLFNFQLSAKNLYPYRHALFVQGAYPLNPLLNAGLAFIYSPVEAQALFVNPSLALSVANNWDVDLIAQIVANRQAPGLYTSPLQAVFLRMRYSF